MPQWRDRLLAEYSRDEALSFLEGIEGLVMQADAFNTELKTSCFLDGCPQPDAAAEEIRRRVEPHADRYQVVWSSGRDLDILPASSGKGKAIRFLVERQGLASERVVVAGDTGNDATMFVEFRQGRGRGQRAAGIAGLGRFPGRRRRVSCPKTLCRRRGGRAGALRRAQRIGLLAAGTRTLSAPRAAFNTKRNSGGSMYQFANDPTHQAFTGFQAPHILMITNHGIHQWDVVPGLPDTGGQNLFVNMFTETLATLGFRITIVNRGGYPHPVTNEMQVGLRYKDARQRILYLEDDKPEFVRKEDMDEQTPRLAQFLWDFLESPVGGHVDLIISHYWDGAKIGALVRRKFRHEAKHLWVPHSLGTVKKRNMKPETWADLRIDERIAVEKEIVGELDGVAATSPLIRQALVEDYGVEQPLFLPPCIDPQRFHPRQISPEHEIYEFIGRQCGLSAPQVRQCRIITEISRTDRTKRKDVLIRAFAKVHAKHPDTLLVVSVDPHEEELHRELWALIGELGVASHVAVMGNIWEWLPDLYAVTDVYCSPSVMEGFGMAVQEAAATNVPVVGSNLIPFVTEYLLDGSEEEVACDDANAPLRVGKGAIVVEADDVGGFACAIEKLLRDEPVRRTMGEEAYRITIPYFTWDGMTRQFLEDVGFGEMFRAQHVAEGRYHLDHEKLQPILQCERLESLTTERLEGLFREEEQIGRFLPDGVYQVDPRDGAVVVFNAARSRRPHDNAEPPTEPEEDGANDPVCRGETTGVIDVAPLSEGFTFINKNLFPVLYPFPDGQPEAATGGNGDGLQPRGMHFLQWTSSYFDRDWYNMPQSDRLIAIAASGRPGGQAAVGRFRGLPRFGSHSRRPADARLRLDDQEPRPARGRVAGPRSPADPLQQPQAAAHRPQRAVRAGAGRDLRGLHAPRESRRTDGQGLRPGRADGALLHATAV